MSKRLDVVLGWAERIANVIDITVPAVRGVVSELGTTKPEEDSRSNDED